MMQLRESYYTLVPFQFPKNITIKTYCSQMCYVHTLGSLIFWSYDMWKSMLWAQIVYIKPYVFFVCVWFSLIFCIK